MEFLLDSTWIVEYLRGNARFIEAIQERRTAGLGMSVVTLAELFSGVARATNREKAEREVRRVLSEVQVLGVDEAIARGWGEEDARLTLAGQKIGDVDLFIAATALTLCTQNRRHFARVEGLKIESVEIAQRKR